MCSIEREPRRHDHTIGTAVAPEAVFTVRTKATNAVTARFSVQIPANPNAKQQVNRLQPRQNPKREPSQVPTWLNLVFDAVADFSEGLAQVVG
jgi:hypothetical protein